MNFEKVVIAVDLDAETLKSMHQIRSLSSLKDSEVHLVHVFELNFLSFDFHPSVRPSPEDYLMIQKVIEEKLQKVKKDLGLEESKKVIIKCLFSPNARQEFLNYAEGEKATLIIAASKERKGFTGLFESSFTSFLNKYSKTNLLILRP